MRDDSRGCCACVGDRRRANSHFVPHNNDIPEGGIEEQRVIRSRQDSRGQTRAHDVLQRDLASTFYADLPPDCPLRGGATGTTTTVQKDYAMTMVATGYYRTSHKFDNAWYRACLIVRSKARTAEISTIDDIRQVRKEDEVTDAWESECEQEETEVVSMSVCGFAIVIPKVQLFFTRFGLMIVY